MRERMRIVLGRLAAVLILSGASCWQTAWAQSPPQDVTGALAYLATLPKEERLAIMKREAAREGELVIYSAIGLDRMNVWLNVFKQENPDIKIEYIRMTTNEAAQKVLTEFRAQRTNADVVMTSSEWLGLLKVALGAYEPTTWSDLDERFRHGSAKDGWTAVDFDSLIEVIAWRTDRVSAAEAPKKIDDLINPKWKGRVATVKVREPFIDAMIELYGEKLAMEKIDALAALDNRVYASIAALSEGIGSGEADIAWGLSGARAAALKAAGRPVDFVVQQPAMTLNETMAVGKLSKHPYASALLMEFVTDLKTMEASDKREPGRVFGHKSGKFTIPLTSDVFVYRELPDAKYRELNRIVERKFIRRGT